MPDGAYVCLGERGWTRNRTKILSSVLENGKEGSKAGKRAIRGAELCPACSVREQEGDPEQRCVEQEGIQPAGH